MVVSRAAACQNSWPAGRRVQIPKAPELLTIWRRPFISVFAAVAEFGFGTNTKMCSVRGRDREDDRDRRGRQPDLLTAVIVDAVTSASVSAVMPISTVAPTSSHPRTKCRVAVLWEPSDAAGSATAVIEPPDAQCARMLSPFVRS